MGTYILDGGTVEGLGLQKHHLHPNTYVHSAILYSMRLGTSLLLALYCVGGSWRLGSVGGSKAYRVGRADGGEQQPLGLCGTPRHHHLIDNRPPRMIQSAHHT